MDSAVIAFMLVVGCSLPVAFALPSNPTSAIEFPETVSSREGRDAGDAVNAQLGEAMMKMFVDAVLPAIGKTVSNVVNNAGPIFADVMREEAGAPGPASTRSAQSDEFDLAGLFTSLLGSLGGVGAGATSNSPRPSSPPVASPAAPAPVDVNGLLGTFLRSFGGIVANDNLPADQVPTTTTPRPTTQQAPSPSGAPPANFFDNLFRNLLV